MFDRCCGAVGTGVGALRRCSSLPALGRLWTTKKHCQSFGVGVIMIEVYVIFIYGSWFQKASRTFENIFFNIQFIFCFGLSRVNCVRKCYNCVTFIILNEMIKIKLSIICLTPHIARKLFLLKKLVYSLRSFIFSLKFTIHLLRNIFFLYLKLKRVYRDIMNNY